MTVQEKTVRVIQMFFVKFHPGIMNWSYYYNERDCDAIHDCLDEHNVQRVMRCFETNIHTICIYIVQTLLSKH
jgi:hypothetical protein